MNRKIAFLAAACGAIGVAQAASAQQAYYAPRRWSHLLRR